MWFEAESLANLTVTGHMACIDKNPLLPKTHNQDRVPKKKQEQICLTSTCLHTRLKNIIFQKIIIF